MEKYKIKRKFNDKNCQSIKEDVERFLHHEDNNILGFEHSYNEGKTFFRVRKCEVTDLNDTQDLWNRLTPGPMGRLNYSEEHPIYLCTVAELAILETGVLPGEAFLLIEYEATKKISLTKLGSIKKKELRTRGFPIEYINRKKIKFVDHWMRKFTGNEKINYEVTNAIKDCFLRIMNPSFNGFYYVSVFDNKFGNIMIFEKHVREVLRIKSAKYCWCIHRKGTECGIYFTEYFVKTKNGKIYLERPTKVDDELFISKRHDSREGDKYYYEICNRFAKTEFFRDKSCLNFTDSKIIFSPWL